MKKLKPLPKKIPHFKSYEEEANFWDTHDTSELMKKAKPVKVEWRLARKRLISLRVDHSLLDGLKVLAAKRHIPYQTLIHTILAEKLSELHRQNRK
jgi:predicted DNA binding CopG/RHH family protein